MKKIVCAVTAIVMLVLCAALFSCGKNKTVPIEPPKGGGTGTDGNFDPGPVLGTWTAEVSARDFLFPSDEWDTASREWNDSTVKLSLQFNDKGKLILGLEKDDVRTFVKNNLESANAMFGYTVEEVMEEGKYESEDALIDDMIDSAFATLNKNGEYTYSDGVLKTELIVLTHSHSKGDEDEDPPSEIKVETDANTLTFTEYLNESEDNELFNRNVLPITFEKHK